MNTRSKLLMLPVILPAMLGWAVAQNVPSGDLQAGEFPANITTLKLRILDPYVGPFWGANAITQSNVVASLSNQPGPDAGGLVTEGTATAIAVCKTAGDSPVTFEGNDGLLFEPWSDSFLNSAPVPGQNPYTVQPIKVNGSYYAFALLQAPTQSASVSYTVQAVSLKASTMIGTQKAESKPVQLGMAPTPVIFVHGLWGDASSLSAAIEYQ